MKPSKKTATYIFFSLFFLLSLLFSLPTLRADATGSTDTACLGGAAHVFPNQPICEVCHKDAAAECSGLYYITIEEALNAAHVDDTVTVLSTATATTSHYEIGEDVTLVCGDFTIDGKVTNNGIIEGGRFTGEVENNGAIANAILSGSLTCYPYSEVIACRIEGAATLYGGRIHGGEIGELSITLCPDIAGDGISVDLSQAALTETSLTITSSSDDPFSLSAFILPDKHLFFPTEGEKRYTDTLAKGQSVLLTQHEHSYPTAPDFRDDVHFFACTVCHYADIGTQKAHELTYTDLENGNHKIACEGCGYTAFGSHEGGTATCGKRAICRLCNAEYGEALTHLFLTYYNDNNATCETDGTKTAVCEHCDERDTVSIPNSRLTHRDTDEDGRCDLCKTAVEPPTTEAPITTTAPVTTATPVTTTAPVTTATPVTTAPSVTVAPPTTTAKPAATTTAPPTTVYPTTSAPISPTEPPTTTSPTAAEPPQAPEAISLHLAPWCYALIGIVLGGFAVLWFGNRD